MPVATPAVSWADEVVGVIAAAWGPVAPDGVQRVYQFTQPAEDLNGRQVWVLPLDYGFEPENRGEDNHRHHLTIVCARRYAPGGLPPTSWVDAEVDFVYTNLVRGLWWGHNGPHRFNNRAVFTTKADVRVCDVEKLTTTPAIFWSVVDLDFEELLACSSI